MALNTDSDFSDDEIFFGKLTLKEVKKHIFMDRFQKNLSLAAGERKVFDVNSTKIIQTNSQPNIQSERDIDASDVEHFKSTSYPLVNKHCDKSNMSISPLQIEDSFLEMEKNVTEQNGIHIKHNNLDNTLDVIDFILNHAPSHAEANKKWINNENNIVEKNSHFVSGTEVPKEINKKEILSQATTSVEKVDMGQTPNLIFNSPTLDCIKEEHVHSIPSPPNNVKMNTGIGFNTPIYNKTKTLNVFKTPKFPVSNRKDIYLKRTPSKSKAFEHISSPIATYIKNSPQVPLVKDVYPKKPLPNTSFIPRLTKIGSVKKISNKENTELPSLAYKSAKTTKVINMNTEKSSQSIWPKKLTSSLHKPVVLKHDYRESRKKLLISQQDSFDNLSLHQADVSICTEKCAFSKP